MHMHVHMHFLLGKFIYRKQGMAAQADQAAFWCL